MVAQGKPNVCKISIYDNLPDIVTKPVLIAKFELLVKLFGAETIFFVVQREVYYSSYQEFLSRWSFLYYDPNS
jgi:hypothetical protein